MTSDRRVASVEISYFPIIHFPMGEDYCKAFRLDIPLNVGMIQNKVLIDYSYTEDQYTKDKEVISDHFSCLNYGQWSKSTIKKITESSMRIQNYEDNKRKLDQYKSGEVNVKGD